MKILMVSYAFYPGVGGIETVGELLAKGFVHRGHDVRVVTSVPAGSDDKKFPFEIIRRPNPWVFFKQVLWSDIVFHNNISLNFTWPLLFIKKPWAITHHTWIRRTDGTLGWQDRIKRFLVRFATNIVISQAVAKDLNVPCEVIFDPYEEDVFRRIEGIPRNKDLIFLGRLVSDKGVDTLLIALGLLKERECRPFLTVVGDGPEREKLQVLAWDIGVSDQVNFVGVKRGNDLVGMLNTHRILVVPSRWKEPFGLVALEGIACGCAVVGTNGGGLLEAIGPCGVTFPSGDAKALAQILAQLLSDEELLGSYEVNAAEHISHHTVKITVEKYLRVFEGAIQK